LTPRTLIRAACCCVLTQCAASSAHAQSSPHAGPIGGVPATSVLGTPTRAVVFEPDRPDAELQRYGIGLVDGIWVEGWVPVCIGPCAAAAPLGERYRVAGPGIRRSKPFEIGPGQSRLRLNAATGLTAPFVVGVVAIPVGSVALAFGALVAGFADLCGTDNHDPHACDQRDAAKTGGLLAVSLGAVAVVAGIVLVVTNKTTVSRTDSPSAPDGASQTPVRLTLQGIEF
jgi:hypothetical protein